jgi:glycosyltransferase involved in cell wall biosynthesis
LERQSIASRIEAIVVSDGHDPATVAAVEGKEWTVPVSFREIPKSQQGTARNAGVREAKGETVLFINDDILLSPVACEAHLAAHAAHPGVAVLGRMDWDPGVGITPVMRWLEETGWQFGFGMLEPHAGQRVPENVQHKFTYASNLSLPTDIAKDAPFPEGLTEYGWEDIVFGMDLKKKGVGLVYEPNAHGLHCHRIDLADSLKRMRAIGRTAALFARRDAAFDRLPKGWKLHAYRALSMLPTMRGRHAKALLEGMNAAN